MVPGYNAFSASMTALLQVYVEGRKLMYPELKHWPDANSTLRITYGQLEGSSPTDGMMYTEHTTLDGIIAKYNTGNPDFELLPRMLDLHTEKNMVNMPKMVNYGSVLLDLIIPQVEIRGRLLLMPKEI